MDGPRFPRLSSWVRAGTLIAGLSTLASNAEALQLLWSNPADSYGEPVRSVRYPAPTVDEEAADDFTVDGTIGRLIVSGSNDCTFGCYNPLQPTGVWVRFYAWTPGGPGALQHETHLAAGDPGFLWDAVDGAAMLDLTLADPFTASGTHFLSVQLEFDAAFNWRFGVSHANAPAGSPAQWRNRAAGGGWQAPRDSWGTPLDEDLSFQLYGCPAGGCPPPAAVAGCGAWNEIASPNPSGDARLYDVDVMAPWDVWAVGTVNGPIAGSPTPRQQSLALHWNGSAWTIVPSPNPAPNPSTTHVSLAAVSGVNTNDVWAVGRKEQQDAGGYLGGRVMALHWDGFGWQDRNAPWPVDRDGSPYTGASGEELYDVVALASNDVWMVGRYWREEPSGVLRWPGVALHWSGGVFQVHELPMVSPASNQWALAVAAVSSNDVWAVGEGLGTNEPAYIWHWNGSNWSAVAAPTPGADRTLNALVALAANDVWAGGSYRDAQYNTFPLLLHWNGQTWTQVPTPAGGSRFAAWASNDILTSGVNGWAHWNGSAWSSEVGPQIVPSGVIAAMDAGSPCELWAVGWKYTVGGERTLVERLMPAQGGGDSDGDGIADAADNCPAAFNPEQSDCDGDGQGDVCELVSGSAADCNGNSTPDNCETFPDCDANGVPDECQADCNANGLPDVCDVAHGTSADCEPDGIPDECQVFDDCNMNGVNDECDLARWFSSDANANGHPDECEALGPDIATVTTPIDVVDFGGAQRMGDLPGPDGLVSFREALIAANNTPGPQTVAFNIPRERWETTVFHDEVVLRQEDGIFVVGDDETTLDFSTQTRFTGDSNLNGGEVAIYGYEPNAWGVAAIYLQADHCTVRGLGRVMQRGYALEIWGNDNRVVGSTISGPLHAGIQIGGQFSGPPASGNVVGGIAPGEGNYVSGGSAGVRIDGPAVGNVVLGNVITGGASGVEVRGASGTRVGGPSAAERNVIHGAGHYGEEGCPTGQQVEVWGSSSTTIEGNWIGLTPDGAAGFGQLGTAGIDVRDALDTTVVGNAIGDILVVGYDHCSGQRYGTAVSVTGTSTGTVIGGNSIGTDATGMVPLANRAGIALGFWPGSGAPAGALIAQNVVANNELNGVLVGSGANGATITGNSIFQNGLLGISLAAGAGNGGQPAPVLTSVTTDDVRVSIAGTLNAAANATFRIEFFANPACDPSGAGEGLTFLGATTVATNGAGTGSFTAALSAVLSPGEVVTATATHLGTGSTSEFSLCRSATFAACSGPPTEVAWIGFGADPAALVWNPFGPSVHYDVARGSASGLALGEAATCVGVALAGPPLVDAEIPAPDEGFFYLVRGVNDCGAGPWGPVGSTTPACP